MPDRRARTLPPDPLTASAQLYSAAQAASSQIFQYQTWQTEGWAYWRNLGELNQGITWQANAISRIRLNAAEMVPGGDEPEPLNTGPAADLMEQFCAGIAGQTAFLKAIAYQIAIPGEGWLVAERDNPTMPLSAATWCVHSTESFRRYGRNPDGTDQLQVRVDDEHWRPLMPDSLPIRIWEPDPEYPWRATSAVEAAIPILRRVDLLDRRIIAMLVSRLAMNGILLIPQEGTFSVPAEYADAADPFVALLIDIASRNIANPGNASAAIPLPVKFTTDLIEKFRWMEFGNPIDEQLLAEREKELHRLATTLNITTERLTGGMSQANHWCVDDQTEVLTARGWRRQDALNVGDTVLTLNHTTGLSEWQPVEDIYRAQVVDEPMLELDRTNHSSLTTLNHRWPVLRPRWTGGEQHLSREWARSHDIGPEHHVITAAASADIPTDPKFTDEVVELVAWLWTEGSLRPGGGAVIAQSHIRNPARVDRIRACLQRLWGPPATARMNPHVPRWRESLQPNRGSHGGPITVFHLSVAAARTLTGHAPGKRVDPGFIRSLTRAQLELFIDVSCQGDGWHYSTGRLDIWQRRPEVLDAFELALILSGRMITNTAHNGGRCVSPWRGTSIRPMKFVGVNHEQTIRRYSGTIWCPTTANRTWLARRRGTVFFTGNSAWEMGDDEIQMSIIPPVETICAGLTVGYLQPMLMAAGAKPLGPNGGRLLVWYDTSELTARPDKSTAAKDLYDRLEIGGTALRRESGFDESDAPEPAELEQMGWRKLVSDPTLGPTAIAHLSGQPLPQIPAAGGGPGAGGPSAVPPASPPAVGPPDTRENPPPPPGQDAAMLRRVLTGVQRSNGQLEQLATLVRAAAPGDDHRANGSSNGRQPPRHRR